MSMIGLFTAGTHAATATTATDDPAAASGFGAALQGALDAMTGAAETPAEQAPAAPVEELPTDSETLLGDFVLSSTSPVVVTPTAVRLLELSATTPDSPEVVSSNPTPLVELVENPTADPLPVSKTAASAAPLPEATAPAPSEAPAAVKLDVPSGAPAASPVASPAGEASDTARLTPVEPHAAAPSPAPTSSAQPAEVAEPATGSSMPAPLPTAQQTHAPAGAAPLVQPLEARAANPVSAPTAPATAAASASVPASARGPVENAAQVPTVVAAPSSVPAPSVTPTAPVAAPSPAASAPLATQLARPIFSLAAAGTGQHVMTVSVTPDNLGPVTLRAHVGADGVRVELFAPNDIGRDAIRAIIPELRRDLAGAGLGGNLTLSSQNQPSAGSDHSAAGHPGAGRGDGTAAPASGSSGDGANDIASAESDSRPKSFGSASTIDVLA